MVIDAGAGPELVIAGAARSGTSFLAAQLGAHPNIDPGSVKEPNFFSRAEDRGVEWYDALFSPRERGLIRMDASVSYTYPQYPQALSRLAATAPDATVVYVVRDPVPRAVSHYLYYRYYFKRETAIDFGEALQRNDLYAGASDYHRWLVDLRATFPRERVLIVPFRAVTAPGAEVAGRVCAALGLPPSPEPDSDAAAHQNQVVTFRHPALRLASRKLRRSRLYPLVRERLGASRLRRVRSLVTKDTSLPTTAEALSSCTPDQVEQLRELERRGHAAVSEALREQDLRLGLSWAEHWSAPNSLP
ncbi:MAG: sulfotransferase [Geodermatophilaceae bacterium]|nr:sulfotransferase [Geodermatophilaceae bacterium]